jgi:hypothetical protein
LSPQTSDARLRDIAAAETSIGSRVVLAATLLLALAVAGGVFSVWITEPHLPARTHVAFGGLVAIAAAWVLLCTRALVTRRALFARHRVVVAWLALVFSILLVAGTITAIVTGAAGAAGLVGAGLSTTLLTGSAMYLVAARRRLARLVRRRDRLERELHREA